MTQRHLRAALAALVTFAAACHGDNPVDPFTVPAAIEKSAEPTATVASNSTAGVFAVRVTNSTGDAVAGATVTFSVTGSATVSPATTTTDGVGEAQTMVTAGPTAGAVTVVARVTGTDLNASTALTVATVTPTSCGGLTIAQTLAVGGVATFQNQAAACLAGTAAGAEYTLVAFNRDTVGAATTLVPSGLATPPSTNVLAPAPLVAYQAMSTDRASSLTPDLAFHRRLLGSRLGAGRFAGARGWLTARGANRALVGSGENAGIAAGATSPLAPSRAPLFSAIGSAPAVGSLVTLNVNGDEECANPQYRAVRIVAVGTRSVVMADTLNPSGGFTTADYQRFAAQFDTLVFPLDTAAFGMPTDIDGNGRVGIVFTSAVNALTPSNSNFYIGGFFYNRDLFPVANTPTFGDGCPGSNEGELFYMLAPDPNGQVNGNVRSTALVDDLTVGTIAHEFQHLINAARRIYVNQGASDYEVTWLNEGLSHVAEELLYYRETGRQPRSNLTDEVIRVQSAAKYTLFKRDQVQNFQRFASYLSAPSGNSPTALNDVLATRGATWSYLRYAADRRYASDGDTWFRLANSVKQGFETLAPVFGADQSSLLRDWAVANYVDDLGISSDRRFSHASWNYRDIFTNTFTSQRYPLLTTPLTSGASVVASLQRTTAAYYRFAVPANGEGLIRLSNTGVAAPSNFQFVVVRTK